MVVRAVDEMEGETKFNARLFGISDPVLREQFVACGVALQRMVDFSEGENADMNAPRRLFATICSTIGEANSVADLPSCSNIDKNAEALLTSIIQTNSVFRPEAQIVSQFLRDFGKQRVLDVFTGEVSRILGDSTETVSSQVATQLLKLLKRGEKKGVPAQAIARARAQFRERQRNDLVERIAKGIVSNKIPRDLTQDILQLKNVFFAGDVATADALIAIAYRKQLAVERQRFLSRVSINVRLEDILDDLNELGTSGRVYPALAGVNYLGELRALREDIIRQYAVITPLQRSRDIATVRAVIGRFDTETEEGLVFLNGEARVAILGLPSRTLEDKSLQIELLDELATKYVSLSGRVPQIVTDTRTNLLESLDPAYVAPEGKVGANKAGREYIDGQYDLVFKPLIKSLLVGDDPEIAARRKAFTDLVKPVKGRDGEVVNINDRLWRRLEAALKQGTVTPQQEAYIRSVEGMARRNPFVAALLIVAPRQTEEYLRNHFAEMTEKTWENLGDDEIVDSVIVGMGPHGLNAMSERARLYPALAQRTLCIDAGKLGVPGGVFAVGGPAFDINSASPRLKREGFFVPDQESLSPDVPRISDYGSPVAVSNPGKRDSEGDRGSINHIGGAFLLGELNTGDQFVTNEGLSLPGAANGALLVQRGLFNTRVIGTERTRRNGQTYVRLNLERRAPGQAADSFEFEVQEKSVLVRPEALALALGLGTPKLGFDIATAPFGGEAQAIIEEDKRRPDIFPRILNTIEAFETLADVRRERPRVLPRRIVMAGSGNSTAVLAEGLLGLKRLGFGLVDLRSVEEVTIVASDDIEQRTRYISTREVRERPESFAAKSGLEKARLKFVAGRVGGVGYDNSGQSVALYQKDGEPLLDDAGQPITADSYIGNAGFQSTTQDILDGFLDGDSYRDSLEPITLQGSRIELAKQVQGIRLLGVGDLTSIGLEELLQYDALAAEALLRNGAGNAVALGRVGPGVTAAEHQFLTQQRITKLSKQPAPEEIKPITLSSFSGEDSEVYVDESPSPDAITPPSDFKGSVSTYESILTSFLGYGLSQYAPRVTQTGEAQTVRIQVRSEGGELRVSAEEVSRDFINAVVRALESPFSQKYARALLAPEGGKEKRLSLQISYDSSGRLVLGDDRASRRFNILAPNEGSRRQVVQSLVDGNGNAIPNLIVREGEEVSVGGTTVTLERVTA